MSELVKNYDRVLESALGEFGLHSQYFTYGEYSFTKDMHAIQTREQKKLFGVIPYTSKKTVARITSEPKMAKSAHQPTSLSYNGLEIKVFEPEFEEAIIRVANILETEFGEPAVVVAA